MALRLSLVLAVAALALIIASALPWPSRAVGGAGDAPIVYSADEIAYGKALFSAKGCASCHQHSAVVGSGQFFGGPGGPSPILTAYPADPAYLRAWLRDPQALKPRTTMPNLGLSDAEITALIAFLKAGR